MPSQPQTQSVETVEREAVSVAVIEHRGDPARLGQTIRTFIAWRREHRLHPSVSATYNVVYDNPDDVPPEAFRMDICAATPAPVAKKTPVYPTPTGKAPASASLITKPAAPAPAPAATKPASAPAAKNAAPVATKTPDPPRIAAS